MNLTDALLPGGWLAAATLVYLAALGWALLRAPWRRLGESRQQHAYFGAIVILAVLWGFSAGIKPGLALHMLGATALTLMFGPQLAIVALGAVLVWTTHSGAAGWHSFGLNGLLMAVLPVLASHAIYRLVDGRLPHNFFVYIFLDAFFGAAAAMLACGAAATAVLWAGGAYALDYLLQEYLPYFILLAWSEALLTGAAITVLVVYHPHWVASFDDARYLRGRDRGPL